MSLASDLRQFTGTDNYYKHWIGGFMYTDGVKYLAETAGAYWLLDIIGTELISIQRKEPFLTIDINVTPDKKALIHVTDGNNKSLKVKNIRITDFPQGEWRLFMTDFVVMLTNEY